MTYQVLLAKQAVHDLQRNAEWWAEHRSASEALHWYEGFLNSIDSLKSTPKRCHLAREDVLFPYELREILYGVGSKKTHRALFTIRESTIVILTIRHTAQTDVTVDDV